MNKYTLATAQLGKTIETVMRGQKGNRYTSSILRTNCIGQRGNKRRRDSHLGGKTFRCESEDTVPDFELADGGPDFGNNPGTFRAYREVSARIHAKRQQNIAEIEARCLHLNPDLILS